jgi:hypothetical protein
MIRTQIQLPEADYTRLVEAARREHRSLAACVREGITLYLDRTLAKDRTWDDVAGRFRPLKGEPLKPHDEWWANSVRPARGRRGRT